MQQVEQGVNPFLITLGEPQAQEDTTKVVP